MPLKLICEFARPNEQVFAQEVIKVGKLSSSHFYLDHPDVSRMHAVIEKDGDGYNIIDLGSHSGTKVDGRKVNKAHIIEGSLIEFGKVVIRVYTEDVKMPAPEPKKPDIIDAYFSLRNHFQELQKKMETLTVAGEAGGGLVKIEMDGNFSDLKISIDDLAMEDKAMLEDLIVAAFRSAHQDFMRQVYPEGDNARDS
jgi:DNA-binding YbaB/EbfC family protein